MIFQHTIDRVLDGTKTQTRRLVDAGKMCKYDVGKTYAVQPGRARKAVGRILITCIHNEHLQDISVEDAKAEGCTGVWAPMLGWLTPAKSREMEGLSKQLNPIDEFIELWNGIQPPGRQWEDNPPVWVIEFELVRQEKGE